MAGLGRQPTAKARSSLTDPFRTVTPSESGPSRVRFDYEHPGFLSFPTFGLDRRISLGVIEG